MMRVAVIGGGPSGLVTLKYLTTAHKVLPHNIFDAPPIKPITVRLFESESTIGGTFRHRAYENAELVSSKQLTMFSDFRLPVDTPDHISLEDYVKYLEAYATEFELWQYMALGARVVSVERGEGGKGHIITYATNNREQQTWECDAIAVCTGLHVVPRIPKIPGLVYVKGRVMHSSEYKRREEFVGKKVLVIGAGETAMDLSYEAVQVAKEVSMSHRSGFLSFPKVLNGFSILGKTYEGNIPIDSLISNLFENSYVHWFVKESRLRWHVSDFFVKIVLKILTGTSIGCHQYAGALPPNRVGRAYTFLNKSTKAMPYINAPFKRLPPWHHIVTYIEPPTHKKFISLRPTVTHFDKDGTAWFANTDTSEGRATREAYENGERFTPDVVALCTGYIQTFPFFKSSDHYPTPETASVRKIYHPDDPTIGFIGFVRPGVGAIPPLGETQAQFYTLTLLGLLPKLQNPTTTHYRLLHPTNPAAVDYSAYMYQLAVDMHSAPSIMDLLRFPWRVIGAYILGAAYTPTFRLVGPWKFGGAKDVVGGEIWELVVRRGFLGNLLMAFIPIVVYGTINTALWVGEWVWWISCGWWIDWIMRVLDFGRPARMEQCGRKVE